MNITGQTDIIPLLRHVCLALKPYAASQNVKINFSPAKQHIITPHHAAEVVSGVSEILCSIISYLPGDNCIDIKVSVITINDVKVCQLNIHNSGINLSRMSAITAGNKFPVTIVPTEANETRFFLQLSAPVVFDNKIASPGANKPITKVPVFFQEFCRSLNAYFIKTDPQLVHLPKRTTKDSAFLKKLNEVILKHIDNESFDANALSKEIALSRAQLLRKLKPLMKQSPACYIKNLRLQKAKELLENEDLSVSEVAYKTGFKTPSNFTKVFIEKYGIRPSVFRRPKVVVTNE